ncbi:helix-turn-helix domain-containing protein [Spirochaetia bacterium 38H-sp]|uniref:Helix-turn-helix domain-containing protein n=1 Tax=Rarispira pelagica TaxID=3141764 RepID=A0ABU9UB95_9SPIR
MKNRRLPDHQIISCLSEEIEIDTLQDRREGKVPCQKIGRHWHFRKEAIDRWLEETHGDTTNRQDSRFGRTKGAPGR